MKITRRSKYRNVRTTVGGITFASKREAARWQELQLMQKAGAIIGLTRKTRWAIVVNGLLVCEYWPDAEYREGGILVVEDTKGYRNKLYALKAKLMQAVHGITIREVK